MQGVFIMAHEMLINIVYFQYHGPLNMQQMTMKYLINFYRNFSLQSLVAYLLKRTTCQFFSVCHCNHSQMPSQLKKKVSYKDWNASLNSKK